MQTNSYKAQPVERGCGRRKAGGIYMECGLAPEGEGYPLEHFLMDPPWKLNEDTRAALGVKAIGVSLLERDGLTHVLDWVGAEYYPNLCDFLEEARRFGLSRRLPSSFPFEKLQPGSRVFIIHARGWLDNAAEFYRALARGAQPGTNPYGYPWVRSCPLAIQAQGGWRLGQRVALPPQAEARLRALAEEHNNILEPPPMCAQLWWHDIAEGAQRLEAEAGGLRGRACGRSMPSFSYFALARPAGLENRYTPAVVASFPLPRIVVIADPEEGSHEAALKKARAAGIPVELEEE